MRSLGDQCYKCRGRGIYNPSGSMPMVCPLCNGKGYIKTAPKVILPSGNEIKSMEAIFSDVSAIPNGDGSGESGNDAAEEESKSNDNNAKKRRGRPKKKNGLLDLNDSV